MKEHWKNVDKRGIANNREEKAKQVEEMFEIIIWGDSHPFYSHWIKQVKIILISYTIQRSQSLLRMET